MPDPNRFALMLGIVTLLVIAGGFALFALMRHLGAFGFLVPLGLLLFALRLTVINRRWSRDE